LEEDVSDFEVNPILTEGLESDMNPKTRIKMSGNPKLNTIALGLLRIAVKLALEMANNALR
jgi:hypothetical protein